MNRRRFLRCIVASPVVATFAVLFRKAALGAEKPDAATMYAKVVSADSSKGLAQIEITVTPSKTYFDLEGNVEGLQPGDFIEFHLGKNEIHWKGRDIALKSIEITP